MADATMVVSRHKVCREVGRCGSAGGRKRSADTPMRRTIGPCAHHRPVSRYGPVSRISAGESRISRWVAYQPVSRISVGESPISRRVGYQPASRISAGDARIGRWVAYRPISRTSLAVDICGRRRRRRVRVCTKPEGAVSL